MNNKVLSLLFYIPILVACGLSLTFMILNYEFYVSFIPLIIVSIYDLIIIIVLNRKIKKYDKKNIKK